MNVFSKDFKFINFTEHFERIFKFKAHGVQAIAAAKNVEGPSEYAVGYSDGKIVYCDIRGKNQKEFRNDQTKASVLSIDINSKNQYLASVYENGSISVFGITTSVRTWQLDKVKEVTSVRFSPSNRYHLAAASYNGHVYLFDFNNNYKQIFHEKAHDAPCRDVSMSEQQNIFYTCGLDSFIKIYDIRKKNSGLQISLDCGLTTISVEPTGNYIVAGNLKGNVIAFDSRQLKRPLSVTKVDDDLITRVSFLPIIENSVDRSSMYKDMKASNLEKPIDDELPTTPIQNDKNFIEEVHNFSRGRSSDFDFNVQSRVSIIGTETSKTSELRKSDFFGSNMKNALYEMFDEPDVQEQLQILRPRENKAKKSRKSSLLSVNSPLSRIREEKHDKENQPELKQMLTPVSSGPRYSSTPANNPKINIEENPEESVESVLDSEDERQSAKKNHKSCEKEEVTAQQNSDIKEEFEKIHEKIKHEVQSLNMDMFQRHIELTTHMTEQRMKLQERVVMIEECMAMMMNDDFKINKIMELQRENQDLRRDMNELIKRINNIPSSNNNSNIQI